MNLLWVLLATSVIFIAIDVRAEPHLPYEDLVVEERVDYCYTLDDGTTRVCESAVLIIEKPKGNWVAKGLHEFCMAIPEPCWPPIKGVSDAASFSGPQ